MTSSYNLQAIEFDASNTSGPNDALISVEIIKMCHLKGLGNGLSKMHWTCFFHVLSSDFLIIKNVLQVITGMVSESNCLSIYTLCSVLFLFLFYSSIHASFSYITCLQFYKSFLSILRHLIKNNPLTGEGTARFNNDYSLVTKE